MARLRRLATKSQPCVSVVRTHVAYVGVTWPPYIQPESTSVCREEPRRRIEIHRGTIFVRSENHHPAVLHRGWNSKTSFFFPSFHRLGGLLVGGIITIPWILNFLSKINYGIYNGERRVGRGSRIIESKIEWHASRGSVELDSRLALFSLVFSLEEEILLINKVEMNCQREENFTSNFGNKSE